MRLFTAMISYNRLELLKRTVNSYLETVAVPFDLWIVDNASDDETRQWLLDARLNVVLLDRNRYPGYATNRGWALSDASHDILHRSDNDIHYLPGWSETLLERFASNSRIGQVGLMTDEQEGKEMPAVGGNMAIRRDVFLNGVRYTDEPWDVVPWEDGMMTTAVKAAGWNWKRVHRQCLVHLGDPPDFDDPYYRETYAVRGILPDGV